MTRKLPITAIGLLLATIIVLAGCSAQKPVLPQSDIPYQIEAEIIQITEDSLDLDLQIPRLSDFAAAEAINALIQETVDEAVEEVEGAAEGLKEHMSANMKATLYCRYLYGYYENYGSVCLDLSNFLGGAHGMRWLTAYNFDTETGAFLSLPEILDATGLGSAERAADAIITKINDSPANYFDTAADTIRSYQGDLPYYINNEQQLVIYFPAYNIAPYSTGIPTFTFADGEIL